MADSPNPQPDSPPPPPPREQFLEQVLELIRQRFPLVKVARSEQSFSLKLNGHSASLENLYRVVTLKPEESRRQIERWVVELLRAAEGAPGEKGGFEDLKERLLPVLLAEAPQDIDSAGIVSQPLIDGLRVAYVLDHDRTISYLPRSLFDQWEIPVDQLHDTAIANLVARSEAINAHAAQDNDGGVYLILFQTMDGYDASRLLLPTLHERLRSYLGSPFVAAVPNRDILICFRNETEVVEKLTQKIGQDYRSMPHEVTDKLFLVTPDGIAPRSA
jgi:uncharacterized protein YtpQ (UPF0354 family)